MAGPGSACPAAARPDFLAFNDAPSQASTCSKEQGMLQASSPTGVAPGDTGRLEGHRTQDAHTLSLSSLRSSFPPCRGKNPTFFCMLGSRSHRTCGSCSHSQVFRWNLWALPCRTPYPLLSILCSSKASYIRSYRSSPSRGYRA